MILSQISFLFLTQRDEELGYTEPPEEWLTSLKGDKKTTTQVRKLIIKLRPLFYFYLHIIENNKNRIPQEIALGNYAMTEVSRNTQAIDSFSAITYNYVYRNVQFSSGRGYFLIKVGGGINSRIINGKIANESTGKLLNKICKLLKRKHLFVSVVEYCRKTIFFSSRIIRTSN